MTSIAALILSAGRSSRFGSPKALARVGSTTALICLIEVARSAKMDPIITVLGADADRIQRDIGKSSCTWIVNSDFSLGQTSSLQTALKALKGNENGAALFLVDHPFVRSETVSHLVAAFDSNVQKVIRPTWEGRGGHPTFIPASIFDELLRLKPQESARGVLHRKDRLVDVPVNDNGVRDEFDTQEEYQRLLTKYAAQQ